MENTEQQMIDVARQGRAEGYKYLMGRYGRQIQLLVAQMVPDARDVEELTQDAFVRAFEHLQDFNPRRASFATWLNRIAYNVALNHLRSQGLSSLPLNEEQYVPPEAADDDRVEQMERLDKAIDHLRPEERALLHLRYYEGHSLGEIAEEMDVAAGPLANRLQRIRQKLGKLIGK